MRDRSLDGWLTQGVVTTGIYCRPSCPARPKPENVRVFESPAAAREAGMRACKRCRPDEAYEDGLVVRHVEVRQPFDADGLLGFFGRRVVPGIEEFDGVVVYRRSLALRHGFGVVAVRSLGERAPDRLSVRMQLDDARDEAEAVARMANMFDAAADPAEIAEALGADPLMSGLWLGAPTAPTRFNIYGRWPRDPHNR